VDILFNDTDNGNNACEDEKSTSPILPKYPVTQLQVGLVGSTSAVPQSLAERALLQVSLYTILYTHTKALVQLSNCNENATRTGSRSRRDDVK
jgi:hypothetical protein